MRIEFLTFLDAERQRVAVIHRGTLISASDLDADAEVIASQLATAGIGSRHRVALLIGNTPAFFVALVAVMKLDASAVLLNQEAKSVEIRDLLVRTGAAVILTASRQTCASDLATDGYVEPLDDGGARSVAAWRTPVCARAAGVDEVVVQFTSGIAGRSKIVPRTAANLVDELSNFDRHLRLGRDDATVCPVPLSHTYGLVNGCLLPLFSGRPVILTDGFLPNDIIDAVRTYKARVLIGVPVMYAAMAKTYGTSSADLQSLALCFSAGAPLSSENTVAFRARYGRFIHQQYGSTETGAVAVNLSPAEAQPEAVGRPIPGREIDISSEDGTPAPSGTPGEIVVRSAATAACYLDDAALTAEKFTPAGYLTGDVGWLDDRGVLFVHGRRRSLINVAGLKVDPVEVENVLLELDGIAECAVVPGRDAMAGEIVRAFVVPRHPLSARDIQAVCRNRLAGHKVPREVVFVGALPRTATGKVIARELIDT